MNLENLKNKAKDVSQSLVAVADKILIAAADVDLRILVIGLLMYIVQPLIGLSFIIGAIIYNYINPRFK